MPTSQLFCRYAAGNGSRNFSLQPLSGEWRYVSGLQRLLCSLRGLLTCALNYLIITYLLFSSLFFSTSQQYEVDFWALGVLTHELLLGRHLFQGDVSRDSLSVKNCPFKQYKISPLFFLFFRRLLILYFAVTGNLVRRKG